MRCFMWLASAKFGVEASNMVEEKSTHNKSQGMWCLRVWVKLKIHFNANDLFNHKACDAGSNEWVWS
jgi:hypothetical protein